jgi:hypothetical protein
MLQRRVHSLLRDSPHRCVILQGWISGDRGVSKKFFMARGLQEPLRSLSYRDFFQGTEQIGHLSAQVAK